MKTSPFKLTLILTLIALVAYGGEVQFRRINGGLAIGTDITDKIGFYAADPIVRPANDKTARQALEDLGLIATGGSDTAVLDAVSVSADNTLSDGVDFTLGSSSGTKIGTATTQKLAFFNATPIVQPAGTSSSQSALTNSTTGTASTTLAAGAGVTTIAIPIQLAAMTTSAADLITNYTPGYAFKVLSVDFRTTTLGAGSSASQVLNLEIGTTNLSGGVVTVTEASTDTLGEASAGTSVTANNVGTSSDTISVEVAASGTVFTDGAGVLLIKLQNMDTANALASLANLANGLRAALAPTTGVGLIKGAN